MPGRVLRTQSPGGPRVNSCHPPSLVCKGTPGSPRVDGCHPGRLLSTNCQTRSTIPNQAQPVCRGVESQAGLAPGLPTPRPLSLQTCLTDAWGFGSSTSMRTSAKITWSDPRQNRCVRFDISRSLHSKKEPEAVPSPLPTLYANRPGRETPAGERGGVASPHCGLITGPASRWPYLAGSHRPPPLRRRLFLGLWSRAEVRPGHALSNSVRGRGDKGPGPERRDLWGPPGRAGRGREP